MDRELVVLGSASQVPTRQRSHNGYLLRWDGEAILFDPGEGAQRQLLLAGVGVPSITRICITHFHGDHCLGLPGIIQRLSLERVTRPITIAFPASGATYFDRLHHASVFDDRLDVRPLPVAPPEDGTPVSIAIEPAPPFIVRTAALRHRTPTVGWQIEEPPGRTMLPHRLRAAGIAGAAIGHLQREGAVVVDGHRVRLEDVSVERPGQRVAFVMDTGWCPGARSLAAGADLLVCEATFSDRDADLAHHYGHLTAFEAGRLAAEAGARRLVITHFSQRYPDVAPLLEEAAAAFSGDVVAAHDLQRVAVPRRRRAGWADGDVENAATAARRRP